MLFGARDGRECEAAKVESAPLVAEPRAASSGARGATVGVASEGGRAGPCQKNDPLAGAEGSLESDFKIGRDANTGVREAALEEGVDALRHSGPAGAAKPRAERTNVSSSDLLATQDRIG